MGHGFDFIHDEKVFSCNFNDLNNEILDQKRFSHSYQIFRIYNCESLESVNEKLEEEGIIVLLGTSSHLLILVLEFITCTTETHGFVPLGDMFPARRPFIMNLVCRNCKKGRILFAEIGFGSHQEVDLVRPPLWIQQLNRVTFEPITASLLEVKLIRKRRKYVHAFTELGSPLIIRFVKLFKASRDEYDWEGIDSSLNSLKIENFLAFMDFPFLTDDCEVSLSEEQRKALKQVDECNKNILDHAVERNNVQVVQFLVRFNFEVDQAADKAWKYGFYYCLLELVIADARFPEEFALAELDDHLKKTFNRLLENRRIFHEAVKNNQLQEIEKFVSENPKLKHAYDECNQSALRVALVNKHFQTYAFLRSQGFSHRQDIGLDEVQRMLLTEDQEALREALKKFCQPYNATHVLQLISKSKLAPGNDPENFDHIALMFKRLDSIAEVCPILKLAAQSEKLQIVFDFENISVNQMDPSKSEFCRGTCYRLQGVIYVAAGFFHSSIAELLGTLAHELTHFAIYLVYDNSCLPYKFEADSQLKYEKVFNKSRNFYLSNRNAVEPVVKDAFVCYEEGLMQHAELISRVPHLAAMFSNDPKRISNSKKQFPELFDFYDGVLKEIDFESRMIRSKVEKKVCKSIPSLKKRKKFNSESDVFAKIMRIPNQNVFPPYSTII